MAASSMPSVTHAAGAPPNVLESILNKSQQQQQPPAAKDASSPVVEEGPVAGLAAAGQNQQALKQAAGGSLGSLASSGASYSSTPREKTPYPPCGVIPFYGFSLYGKHCSKCFCWHSRVQGTAYEHRIPRLLSLEF
jgi:hypothetical protein